MKKILAFLFASSFAASSFAYLPTGTIDWDLGVGWRHDDLKWSIAGTNNYPNVLSELEWKNVQSVLVSGQFKMSYCDYLYTRANADYGWIYKGNNVDSDYHHSHRRGLFSLSKNKANDGNVWDASIATGWRFPFDCDALWINPLIGYAVQHQNLCMRNGEQIVWTDYPEGVGPIHNLNSTYSAQWKGFWAGFDAEYYFDYGLSLYGLFEYHWNTQYHGIGHWNLRRDFGRFHHKAQGWGTVGGLQLNYNFWCDWFFGLSGTYSFYRTKNGLDRTPIWGEGMSVARLNPVQWESYNLQGHLSVEF